MHTTKLGIVGPKPLAERARSTGQAQHAARATPPLLTPMQPKDLPQAAQAQAALVRALGAYQRGDYALAKQALKQAIVWQPFLAPAHLTLGKIYLLQGMAAANTRHLVKGRRLVEMARKLDPALAEAAVFLQLFPEY